MTDINNGDALRAQSWGEYIGQDELKSRLNIHIQAAVAGERMLPHVLLAGPPGYGKTTLAQIIARELNDEFRMLKMSATMQPRVIEALLRSWQGGVLLLDELHTASKAIQHELLTLLEDGYVTLRNGRRLEHHCITVIGATTEPQMLIAPLSSRFTLKPFFASYSDEDMTDILLAMAAKIDLDLSDKLAIGLARATGGTPRLAKKFIFAARDLLQTGNDPSVESVLQLLDIDEDGLTQEHMSYLVALDELGGVAGVDKLANMSRLHLSTINNIERLLVQRSFITYGPAGRELTQAGAHKVRGTEEGRQFRKVPA